MAATLDFAQIKQDHRIEDVAERLGLELKKASNGQLRGPCFSGAEGDRKLVVTPAKALWYSFALNKGGDVIALVAAVNNVDAKTAAQWIVGDTAPEKGRSERSSSPEGGERGFSALTYLEFDHPAVDALGLDAETAERIGCGFCPRGIYKGKVAWPVRTDTGQLIGYIAIEEAQLPPTWKW